MTLLELLTDEYINIVEYLEETEAIENSRIIIDKETFKKLMGKYNYMKFSDKTRIYKQLNFIIHDKNNYTLPVKNSETKRAERKVVINYDTYRTIKELRNTKI